jgi:hypothetical protein
MTASPELTQRQRASADGCTRHGIAERAAVQSPGIGWEQVRAEFEAGATIRGLSKTHGVSRAAIQKRAAKEGWAQDAEPAIQRKVTEKVAGVVATCNPKKKAEAIDAEAERRAAVIKRHRDEWSGARERLYAGLTARRAASDAKAKALAFDDLKAAKIAAETLQIMQNNERKNHRLDDVPGGGAVPKIEVTFMDEGTIDDDE